MTNGTAGIDPIAATGLVAALTTTADDLSQRRRRLKNTLDAVGQVASAPGRLAEVEAWLIASAADLRRRVGLVAVAPGTMGPLAPGFVWAAQGEAPSIKVVPASTMGPLPPGTVWAGEGPGWVAAAGSPFVDWSRTGIPEVADSKLRNILNDLYEDYRPGMTGSGSTPDAVRAEIATGLQVAGHWHFEKAVTLLRGLLKRLRSGDLNEEDTLTTECARDDVLDSLYTGLHPDSPPGRGALGEEARAAGEAEAAVDESGEAAGIAEQLATDGIDLAREVGTIIRDTGEAE